MTNNDKKISSKEVSYATKSGKSQQLKYEYSYIIFDDILFGLQKNVKVDLAYSDGTKKKGETDSEGKIKVSKRHGNYVDAELSLEYGKWRRRVFVLLADPMTQNGAWQRLVNLGYVPNEKPDEFPPGQIELAKAVGEFQADHSLGTNAELELNTMKKLIEAHDEENAVWAERECFEIKIGQGSEREDKSRIT